jgi:hypothetical protein
MEVTHVETDSPDLMLAMQLLDDAKQRGFAFQWFAPDGPLVGHRVSGDWADLIHIARFSRHCFAWRERISSLTLPEGARVQRRVDGNALDVLNEVAIWRAECDTPAEQDKTIGWESRVTLARIWTGGVNSRTPRVMSSCRWMMDGPVGPGLI